MQIIDHSLCYLMFRRRSPQFLRTFIVSLYFQELLMSERRVRDGRARLAAVKARQLALH